jgi:hypothetical protein
VQLSFFWWMQALAWGFPWPKVRLFALVIAALIHYLVWRLVPAHANTFSGWRWPILFALLLSAAAAACLGMKLMRRGEWEGPSRALLIWNRRRSAPALARQQPFRSALVAQFWLEWRRQGLLLPVISGGIAGSIVAVAFIIRRILGTAGQGGDPESGASLITLFVGPTLALPLIFSALLAPLMAGFDRFHTTRELPVYIAVRPMSNGGLILAKLAMALATSALTWLVTAGACFCLLLMEQGTLFSKAGLITPYGPVGLLTECGPVLLLLVLWTWKNLVAGVGAGVTGRRWFSMVSGLWTLYVVNFGLFLLVDTARSHVGFRTTLLRWLTAILMVCLAGKIAVSIVAFVWGWRRKAVTLPTIGWITGGWLAVGSFAGAYAGHVCRAVHIPELQLWIWLGALLIVPLADLAIAPLALAWNRHR